MGNKQAAAKEIPQHQTRTKCRQNSGLKSVTKDENNIESSTILKRIKTCNQCLETLEHRQDEVLNRLTLLEKKIDELEAWREASVKPKTPKKASMKNSAVKLESQLIENSPLQKRQFREPKQEIITKSPKLNTNNVWKTRYQEARARSKIEKLTTSSNKNE